MNRLRPNQPLRRQVLLGGAALITAGNAALGDPIASGSEGGSPVSTHVSSTMITIEHVTIRSTKPFEAVRAALEAAVPQLDHSYAELLRAGQVDAARDVLDRQAPLSIFGARDHGTLLHIAGSPRKAIQYDIGNPLTATYMTRHVLSAALYAPIRVLLREGPDGDVAFEYDRPSMSFEQFNDKDVDAVASRLDRRLEDTLAAAAA